MSATLWVMLVIALILLGFGGYRLYKGDFVRFVLSPIVIGALLLSGVLVGAVFEDEDRGDKEAVSVSTLTPDACGDTWALKKADYGKSRWFADGIAQIKKAKTEEEARDATEVWLNRAKTDPILLDAAADAFVEKAERKDLFQEDGCASEEAVKTVLAIEQVIAESELAPVASAPADTLTSGVENGQMVAYDTTGNDRAIEIIKPSGEKIWIESDCGNVVTEYKHRKYPPSKRKPPKPRPTPPTSSPRCPWNPSLPPNHPKCLKPKDPRQDVSQNDDVADWKKDGDDRHSVDEDADGASDPRGRQDDPREDAEEAEEEAEEETEELEEQHEEESKDDVEVDENQENSEDSDPEW